MANETIQNEIDVVEEKTPLTQKIKTGFKAVVESKPFKVAAGLVVAAGAFVGGVLLGQNLGEKEDEPIDVDFSESIDTETESDEVSENASEE